jgi:hypothetical protein
MRMDSMRPPVLRPKVVPRSYTKLNSTYLRGVRGGRGNRTPQQSTKRQHKVGTSWIH